MRLQRYCSCGAVLKTDVSRAKQQQALSVWYANHSGSGHADTTAAEAERIRMGFGQPMGREARKETIE